MATMFCLFCNTFSFFDYFVNFWCFSVSELILIYFDIYSTDIYANRHVIYCKDFVKRLTSQAGIGIFTSCYGYSTPFFHMLAIMRHWSCGAWFENQCSLGFPGSVRR